VDVHVDEPGEDEEAARVERLGVAVVGLRDAIAVDQEIAERRLPGHRIDDRAARDAEPAHARAPVRRRGSRTGSVSPAPASSALLRAMSR
jgi:hypothetical protein